MTLFGLWSEHESSAHAEEKGCRSAGHPGPDQLGVRAKSGVISDLRVIIGLDAAFVVEARPDSRRADLFARGRARLGWDLWGPEVDPRIDNPLNG